MEFIDEDGDRVILPNNPFWLLNVQVKAGECTPFNALMLYDYQFLIGLRQGVPLQPVDDSQADGTP